MINNVTLVGRTTKDIELKYTQSGIATATFTLAVNRNFKNAQGEQEADFILVQVWRKQAENVAQYVKKGHQVGVVGRIQTRNYENQQGQRVYVTEVVADSVQFLEPRNQQQPSRQPQYQGQGAALYQPQNNDPFKGQGEPIDISSSDLPF